MITEHEGTSREVTGRRGEGGYLLGRDGGTSIMLSLEWLGPGVVEGGVVMVLPDLSARGCLGWFDNGAQSIYEKKFVDTTEKLSIGSSP